MCFPAIVLIVHIKKKRNIYEEIVSSKPFFFALAAEEYKYDPVPNKAEYFMGKFNENRDMDDLLKWGDKFVDWMEDKSAWDSMETVVSTPYFSDDMQG